MLSRQYNTSTDPFVMFNRNNLRIKYSFECLKKSHCINLLQITNGLVEEFFFCRILTKLETLNFSYFCKHFPFYVQPEWTVGTGPKMVNICPKTRIQSISGLFKRQQSWNIAKISRIIALFLLSSRNQFYTQILHC